MTDDQQQRVIRLIQPTDRPDACFDRSKTTSTMDESRHTTWITDHNHKWVTVSILVVTGLSGTGVVGQIHRLPVLIPWVRSSHSWSGNRPCFCSREQHRASMRSRVGKYPLDNIDQDHGRLLQGTSAPGESVVAWIRSG